MSAPFLWTGFLYSSYYTMEFKGLTSASHMSLPKAGYGSEEGYVGSEISGAVSGVTTPGASRLQASQLQQRSTTMQRLHIASQLQHIPTTSFAQWADSMTLIRRAALTYEKAHRITGFPEIQVLMRESTIHSLAPGAEEFLQSKGYDVSDPHTAYRVLTALAEQSESDRTGQLVLDKLKTTLTDTWSSQPWRRTQEVWRLIRQLQVK